MGIYNTIELAFSKIVYDIITSANICKLIYYDEDNPLRQPVVENPIQLIYVGKNDEKEKPYHRIFLTPKIPTITEVKKTIIIPRIWNIKPTSDNNKNIYFSDFTIIFDILTHVSLWTIENNGIRVFKIMDELNDLYSRNRKEYGMGFAIPKEASYVYTENWCGYRIGYTFTDFSKDNA